LPSLAPETWTRLPDSEALARLESAAAARYGAKPAAVVAGPGSQALIQALAWLAPKGEAAALGATYGGHKEAFAAAGRTLGEAASLDALAEAEVGIVVNPNNPDGRVVSQAALLALHARLKRRGGWLIVDEAFADFDARASLAPALPETGAIVLRSFGKTYGLPGLRLGFALASPDVGARLRAALGPWAVSGPAIAIGTRGLADTAWLSAAGERLAADAARLDTLLQAGGFRLLGGTPLFRLVGHSDAPAIFRQLLAAGILARPFAHAPDRLRFGFPAEEAHWLRLAKSLAASASGSLVQATPCGAQEAGAAEAGAA
jgi:cobalamin biosynthetic protein CobC